MQLTKLSLPLIASLLISGCGSMLAQSKHQERGGRYLYEGVQTDLAGVAAGIILPFHWITQDSTHVTPEMLAIGPVLSAFFLVDIPLSFTADTIYSLNLLARGEPVAERVSEGPKQAILLCRERGEYRVCSATQNQCRCEKWNTDIDYSCTQMDSISCYRRPHGVRR